VKEIDDRFILLENRVKLLVNQNKTLRAQLKQLEQDIEQLRREAQQGEHVQGKKLLIREKLESILQTLENANVEE